MNPARDHVNGVVVSRITTARTDPIGRERELADIADRLARARVVTITGPGGIGKTTLAHAAAARLADRFEWGVRVVDLTRIEADGDVGAAMAAQLGYPSFETLLSSPTEPSVLVVVDNCEHVLDRAADAIGELLEACASPSVLATSRSPLDLPGESLVPLSPLEVLPVDGGEAPAVCLFLERAQDAGVDLTGEAEDVRRLCRMLDGVPLAIEIAAARTRVLTPTQIIDRLDDLDVLARAHFRGPQRHRSLRETIEWSYELLDDADRRTFDRLGVLAGSFTVDDAVAIAGESGPSSGDGTTREATILASIERLVAASLLVAEPRAGTMHHRLLDQLRTFARERLVQSGEWDATWRRFVAHVTRWSAVYAAAAVDGWSSTTLSSLLPRLDGHLAALRWCIDHDERADRAVALVATLWGVVHQGHVDEVAPLAEAALERWPEPQGNSWADAVATAATCRYLRGSHADAIALAERALPHASSVYAPATLRRLIAHARCATGDVSEAVATLDTAIEHANEHVPALAMEMRATRAELLADLARQPADVGGALAEVRAVRREAEAADAALNAVWAQSVEASVLSRSDPDAAETVAVEALDAARRASYPACESVNLHTLAQIAIRRGDHLRAAEQLLSLVETLVENGAEGELRNLLRTTAVLLERHGRPAWRSLAASAEAMPVVSVFDVPGHERLPLPAAEKPAPSRRDAVLIARRELRAVFAGIENVPEAEPAVEFVAEPVVEPHVLARRGDVWEITWEGSTVGLRDAKGLHDLAHLLDVPGREVHCLDLAGTAGGVDEASTGDLIDVAARREYEQRIIELQADVEEAEAFNDHVRAERAQTELDSLVDHLAAALGMGGRTRRAAGSVERARSTVTHRLRATIRRIERELPSLGRHLEASIRTGTYCSYQPEHPMTWHVET